MQFFTVYLEQGSGWSCSVFCAQPCDQCSSLLCIWSRVQDGAVRCSALNHVINVVLYCVVGAGFRMELFGVLRLTMRSMQSSTVLLEHGSGWSCSVFCPQPFDQCSSLLCCWRTVQDGAVQCSALNHVINAVLYCVVGAQFRMELYGVLRSTM